MTAINQTTTSTNKAIDRRTGKFLSFRLGKEDFAIEVLGLREIMGIQDITEVPHAPPYMKGVINLRGKVVPVIDLRLKFGLPEIQYTHRTCIIVMQMETEAGKLQIGSIVDGVSEVLTLQPGDMEDTPDLGEGTPRAYVTGMAKVKGKVKLLLDVNMVLTAQDVRSLESVLR